MIRSKVMSYLGFAAKSRNLIAGYNTCLTTIPKGKVKLIILAEDVSENTKEKLKNQCIKNDISYKIFGNMEELSSITGRAGKGVFGICDKRFAEIIGKEIDLNQSEREVF